MPMQIEQLFDRLSNFYWSPLPPASYVIKLPDGRVMGVGIIAHYNYAAFNLAWGMTEGRHETQTDQAKLVAEFTRWRLLTSCKMGEQTVGDWVCMLKPNAFLEQLRKTPVEEAHTQICLEGIAYKATLIKVKNDI